MLMKSSLWKKYILNSTWPSVLSRRAGLSEGLVFLRPNVPFPSGLQRGHAQRSRGAGCLGGYAVPSSTGDTEAVPFQDLPFLWPSHPWPRLPIGFLSDLLSRGWHRGWQTEVSTRDVLELVERDGLLVPRGKGITTMKLLLTPVLWPQVFQEKVYGHTKWIISMWTDWFPVIKPLYFSKYPSQLKKRKKKQVTVHLAFTRNTFQCLGYQWGFCSI